MKSATTLILDGIWGRPWRFERLARCIEARGGRAEVYHYDCTGRSSFEQLGKTLAERIQRIGGSVNLVGYSMGGLVVRSAYLIDPTIPLHKAVLMNAPNEGSWLAYLLPLPAIRQMRPNSAFLRQLRQQAWTAPTLVVWNAFDQMVIPARSTRWKSATASARCALPMHLWPVWSRTIHQQVADFLAEDERASTADQPRRMAS